jgi:flagellar assembly protein FliH
VIQKYTFKVLTTDDLEKRTEGQCQEKGGTEPYIFGELGTDNEDVGTEPAAAEMVGSEIETPSVASDAMLEEMLKKVDELSSELVKTQMLLEKQEKEFASQLEVVRKEGYEAGYQAGKQECIESFEKETKAMQERLSESIALLEESRRKFLEKVDTVEEELIETALDLAKQVVVKEVEKHSKEIAYRLAELLMKEVKEASEVTLKVNPEDFEYLKEKFAQDGHVKVVPDKAVAPGGVILLSNVGNIDGEIMSRFERIKEAVFGSPAS